MARQVGPFYIVGQLDDYLFYELNGGYFVKRIRNGAGKKKQSERSKENASEFSHLQKVGKAIREALGIYWRLIKDPQKSSRLTKFLTPVKKADSISVRGYRSVYQGLKSEEGRALLEGIDLNKHAELEKIFSKSSDLEIHSTGVSLKGVVPERDIHFPKYSNAVRLTVIRLALAPEGQEFCTVTSQVQVLQRDNKPVELDLRIPELHEEGAIQFIMLSMYFVRQAEDVPGVKDASKDHVLTILKGFSN